uniref:Lipoma HMGIC fusion partner-like 2 protein n=1 Tax=Elaeophora elaphi TaxID=1147741 RepID=A0A0R3S6V1_9BILA
MCYSFCAVPFSLFVFGLEIYYSTCPWINDYYRVDNLRRDYASMESYFDMQCGISGWALAGILSLLSCSLFISEGLVSAFFRSESTRQHDKMNAFL